jgi:hypothetical protein
MSAVKSFMVVFPFAWGFLKTRKGRPGGKATVSPKILFVSGGSREGNPKRKNLWIDAGARPAITQRQILEKTREQERRALDRRPRMLRCAMNGSVIAGVTGHQKNKCLDWNCVSATLRAELGALGRISRALSSLAAGSDQRFATVALELRVPVTAVLPMKGYERFLRGRDLARYHELLARCYQLVLDGGGRPNEAFLAAGRYIVDHCDVLFAVWD